MNATGVSSIDTSNIVSTFDIDMPEKRKQLLAPYGNQFLDEYDIFESLGYQRGVAQDQVEQYEEDWITQYVHIGSGGITEVDAGDKIYSFLLNTAAPNNDFLTTSAVAPYGAATYKHPLEKWMRVALPSSDGLNLVYFSVTNISGSGNAITVTIQQNDTDKTFTYTDYAQGDIVIIPDNAYAEGTGQPLGQVNEPVQDTNYLQILKGGFKVTGTQMTNRAWFDYADFGGDMPAFYIKGQFNAEYELKKRISNMLSFGQVTNNSIIDSDVNEPIKSAEGHLEYAYRRGTVDPYVGGTWSPVAMDEYNKILDSMNAPDWYCGMMGVDLFQEKTNALKAYLAFTQVEYIINEAKASLFNGDAGKQAAVNFTYFGKDGRNFGFAKMKGWSDVKSFGATGFSTPGLGFYFPMAWTRDAKTQERRPFLGMLYKKLGGYSRKAEVWTLSGAGPGPKVRPEDVNQLCMRSHVGTEHYGGQLMIVTPRS